MPKFKYVGPSNEDVAPDGVKHVLGVPFPRGELVDVTDPDVLARVSNNAWFEKAGPGRPRKKPVSSEQDKG